MKNLRLKQIGLAIWLMASLLVGSASACMCTHHQEKTEAAETSCHGSHQESVEKVESPITGNAFEVDCICFVNQATPFIVSKSESKKHKAHKSFSNSDQALSDLKFVTAKVVHLPLPEFSRDLSYSSVLESLVPARAPPRL